MKVLIISTNTLPAAPSGPAYIAGAARDAHHTVRVFECLFAGDLKTELAAVFDEFQPDVVGISIRLVFGDELDPQAPFGTRYTDLRWGVKEIVDVVRHFSNAFIVLGGPGFNYFAVDWLKFLDLDYGIRGEAEESFPLFLKQLGEKNNIDTVPGSVFRRNGRFGFTPPRPVENLDGTALPAYDLLGMEQFAARGISPAIFTKRGCAFDCTFCPYSKLEGKRYRLKSPERVVAEIRHIQQHSSCKHISFCENSFNVPRAHAESICQAMISHHLDIHWGTGDLKPIRVTPDFCRLMADAGCDSVNLAIESASEEMLKRMKRGYTVRQVRESIEVLSRSGLPFSASLLIGAPGETPGTIRESLQVLADYEIPNGVWVTVGVYLWTDLQEIVSDLRQAGQLEGVDLFSGQVYLSPALSRPYIEDLLAELKTKPGFQVQVNKSTSLFA